MAIEKIFESKLSCALYPLSLLYEALVKLRLFMYKKGLLSQDALPGFVVSVGNLSVGGTGKTPLVIKIGEWAKKKGYKVGIISRGYKGSYKDLLLVSNGTGLKSDVISSGDEPYLIARRLKEVVVCVSKNKAKAGRFISKKYGIDFFILDDGFQHIRLKRDLDIVLLGKRELLNKRVLPSGPLREPLKHLRRADLCITTGGNSKLLAEARLFTKKVFFASYLPKKVVFPEREIAPHFLKKKKVIAFAGIAMPERFKETLEELEAEVLFFQSFPDHYWFSERDITRLISLKKRLGADMILTTEKDWVRLVDKNTHIGYIEVEIAIKKEEEFFAFLQNAYERKKDIG